MMATPPAQDCVTGYGLPSRSGLIDPYVYLFVSSADMNLLLLIALELRLAPLHALQDTTIKAAQKNYLFLMHISPQIDEGMRLFNFCKTKPNV